MAAEAEIREYYLPESDASAEAIRLEGQHITLWRALGQKLHIAPKSPGPRCVLDIGCGNGSWTRQFAGINPSSQVYGVDLTPPVDEEVFPINCNYIKGDVERDWSEWLPAGVRKFDYIYCRFLVYGIRDWPGLIRKCYDHLREGGWVEFHEMRPTVIASGDTTIYPTVTRLRVMYEQVLRKLGRCPDVIERQDKWMEDAGFAHIQRQPLQIMYDMMGQAKENTSVGVDPRFQREVSRDMARSTLKLMMQSMRFIKPHVEPPMSEAEAQQDMEKKRREMQRTPDEKGYLYADTCITIGQKVSK